MKIILAGSPSISVNTFEKIINNFDVVGIVTQPDKPKGRGMALTETPVSILGKKYGIKVFKPKKILDIKKELEELNYDIFLSFAFGQLIPECILKLGKFKPVNIHGSLLPKYRGAAPIHYAILNNDKKIGITLIEMIKEMDAGDIFFKAHKDIDDETTTGEAFDIIDKLACENIVEWLKKINDSKVKPIKQGENFTLSPKIHKSFGNLQNLNIYDAMRKIRGLNPFPGAFTFIDGKRIKVFNASQKNQKNAIKLLLSDGILYANDYQWESKKRIVLK